MPTRPSLARASWLVLALSALAVPLLRGPGAAPVAGAPADGRRLRRPVALALVDGGKRLFVANRRTGSVSVIDMGKARAVAEVPVGRGLADVAATPDGRWLLAADEEGGELVVLKREGDGLRVAGRRKVPHHPVSVRVAPGGDRCFVASLWARQLSVLDLADPSTPAVLTTVDLPFAPRLLLFLPKARRLLVADSHGGQLAVVDPARGKAESVRALPAHNIRGLAASPSGESVLLAHQLLSALATTSRDDVHWGNLLTNNLRSVPAARLLDPGADPLRGGALDYLGDVGAGAADPAGLAVRPDGTAVVTLGGVGEVAVGRPGGAWRRIPVGPRPTAVVLGPDGRTAYVANTFADSVSVLDLAAGKVAGVIRLGPVAAPAASDRGEQLFYDGRLSHDGWLSCHSCHTDGHSNGLLNDNLSDGTYGTPKRVLSLLGVKDTGPWAWDGGAADLKGQIRASVETTMRGRKLTPAQAEDLEAYLKTLAPPPPPARVGRRGPDDVARGRKVFEARACARCHAPPHYSHAKAFDVGLRDEAGKKAFNPPSLRGVSQGARFLHDNRAGSLREVFGRHRHGLEGDLAPADLQALLAFLESL
jgi:YVTN family beta-propeller protein